MVEVFFDSSVFNLNSGQWRSLLPFLWLSCGLAFATIAAGLRVGRVSLRLLSLVVLVPFICGLLWDLRAPAQSIFGTSFEVNALTRLAGASVSVLALLATLFTESTEKGDHPEWLLLVLTAVLGMTLLPGARDWVSFFVALETLSIPAFVLAALDTHREKSLQAGLKYLLMGAFASALLLMGMTLLYGYSGSFDFARIRELSEGASPVGRGLALAGFSLVLASLLFKASLVPFHMWAADVYQACPTGVAAFLGTATKVSVFAATAVALDRCGAFAFLSLRVSIEALAVATIIVGNLMAAAQTHIRRMFAYSGIANAGYAALALSIGAGGVSAMITSLSLYGLSLIAALGLVEYALRASGRPAHEDVPVRDVGILFGGLSPLAIILFGIAVFSIAGLPPLPGFLGKYLVLKALWSHGSILGPVFLCVGTLIGLAYYLRIFVPVLAAEGASVSSLRKFAGGRSAFLAAALASLLSLALLFGFSRFTQWMSLAETFAR